LTQVSGDSFDLISSELSELFSASPSAVTVEFTGFLEGGGFVSQEFSTAGVFGHREFVFDTTFASWTSVTWDQGEFTFHQFDNGRVDNLMAVPEPSFFSVSGMLVSALAMNRRRKLVA